MKIAIEKAGLLKLIGRVRDVADRRNPIPVLSNLLLKGDEGMLSVTATDMDFVIHATASARIDEAGMATAPAHMLYDITRKLPEDSDVLLESDEHQIKLCAGSARFFLASQPLEQFPPEIREEPQREFHLDIVTLRNMIERTHFAMSHEETRYYLNGLHLHVLNDSQGHGVMRAVATDGHRLARIEIPMPEGSEGMPGVIIPRKVVDQLKKLMGDLGNNTEATIGLSETRIRITLPNIILSSKLVEGNFPDYERVIPSGNDKQLTIDCQRFREAVDRVAAVITTDRFRAIKLLIAKDAMTLSVNNAEHNGSASEEITITYDADDLEIGFNSTYLLDIARQIRGHDMQFNLADPATPTLLRDSDDGSALYVLMPLRV